MLVKAFSTVSLSCPLNSQLAQQGSKQNVTTLVTVVSLVLIVVYVVIFTYTVARG